MRNWPFRVRGFFSIAFIILLLSRCAMAVAQPDATALPTSLPTPLATPVPTVATPVAVGPLWFCIAGIFFLGVAGAFFGYLAPYTNILRDQGPNPGLAGYKTYSLSRCQMALWFFVVLGSFMWIYLKDGSTTLSETALVLMGISFGTTAAATVVDSGKLAQARSQENDLTPRLALLKSQLQLVQTSMAPGPAQAAETTLRQADIVNLQKQLNDAQQAVMPQPSQALLPDLLSDDGGASLHRFQMAVWTLVLIAIFIHDVVATRAMPDFSSTLLALMGISNGVYVGLKIPEK
jgi:hypothetical protein